MYEVLHAEMERRRLEKEKREFRLLLLQKVLNLMLDGNDGIITKRLFFQRLKDKNDLRKSIGLKTTKNTIICCSCNKELVSIACDDFEWFR